MKKSHKESISSHFVSGSAVAGHSGSSAPSKSTGAFIDKALIVASGGRGGDGSMSFRREKYVPFGGPDGGTGGRGGDVWLEATDRMSSLLDFKYRPRFTAADGGKGASSDRTGRSAEDLVISVPVGTIIRKNGELLADLSATGMRVLAVRGGRGGRGNKSFKTAMNTAPRIYEKGQPAETATLELELKLIADVGIIGVPNAGKSSILAKITSARPKIASYPFTTLSPNLGVATIRSKNVVFADIPGLIEGARDGKGLGHDFLRHIERTGLLLHVVDASGASGDPLENYKTLISELGAHSKELIKKPTVIALNKMDVPESARVPALFRRRLKGKKIFPISAVTGDGLSTLMDYCARAAAKRAMPPPVAFDDNRTRRFTYEKPFTVEWNGDVWVLSGKRIDDLAEMTDFTAEETLVRFQHIIKKMGVDKALLDAGAAEGDTVRIGSKEFDFET